MRELIDEFNNVKLMIFDLDGVIYRGSKLIPRVDKIIQDLKDLSIQVVYNSNNSTATREMYVERLKELNIRAKIEDFYTSASITSTEISKLKKNANIFLIGEIGLREELKAEGHQIVTSESNFKDVDFVIVGLDRKFKYEDLAIAQKCILQGNAQFYATNTDATLPVDDRVLPGAGVMVNALETCTGKKPIKVFGKPQPDGMKSILTDRNVLAENAIMFGDRLDTDILAGNRTGIKTVLVLTGVTSKKKIDELKGQSTTSNLIDKFLIPDFIINKLEEIFKN